ncbi:MAG: A/G-specific adenine glycosylase [Kiritimatiellae bacterium]|nr:A/G-specific adenine glycosylase [Kiritimatiellia bacterium]
MRQIFVANLLEWFEENKRDLPWRKNSAPYRVWVSELMLQQTRADQVIPYYKRFMKAFPSLRALALSPRQEVLKVWEGLGYYARARNMHETAQFLVKEKKGRFPRTYEGLKELPGIGPYTAAAIGSLAFNLDEAVVDGNVARVLSRLFAYSQDVGSTVGRKQIQEWANELLPKGRAAAFNESVMELGALICLPQSPKCDQCPLKSVCRAYAKRASTRYPVKKKKKPVPHKVAGVAVVVRRDGKLLIDQRNEEDMLGGLWEFPGGKQETGESIKKCIKREIKEELGVDIKVGKHLTTVYHVYSHFTLELHVHWAKIIKGRPRAIECKNYRWVDFVHLREYPFSRADIYIIEEISRQKSKV